MLLFVAGGMSGFLPRIALDGELKSPGLAAEARRCYTFCLTVFSKNDNFDF